MKIEMIQIKNFRSFKNKTIIFNDYTCVVGPNGAGKSNILAALNVFFRESSRAASGITKLSAEDFHHRNTSEPIEITVTFCDINDAANQDLKDYIRHDKLIVSAVAEYSNESGDAPVIQYGERLGFSAFGPFFASVGDKAPVKELKILYDELRVTFPDLPSSGTKDAMIESLRAYESSRPDECVVMRSKDQFYGVSRGVNRLEKHVQWVYIPAVKDASDEQTEGKATALGQLLARTVRSKVNFQDSIRQLLEQTTAEYQKMLSAEQGMLKDIETALAKQLSVWAHPSARVKLEWQQDPKKSVQIEEPLARTTMADGVFEGELFRFGHGMQRSYLLALLQVLASVDDKNAPTLLLGCEEPELYQHPPQARHLAAVFEALAGSNAQILVSTHHPAFVTGAGFEAVRMTRFDTTEGCTSVSAMTFEQLADRIADVRGKKPIKPVGMSARLHQVLQPSLNEMFFAQKLVLVEGLEDVAYIHSWIVLSEKLNEYRQQGIHIVPVSGKSYLVQPLIIAQGLRIPTYVVFDADTDDTKHATDHETDNKALLKLLGLDPTSEIPDEHLWGDNFAIWKTNINDAITADVSNDDLQRYKEQAEASLGQPGGLGKNSIFIGEQLRLLVEDGKTIPVLDRVCDGILAL